MSNNECRKRKEKEKFKKLHILDLLMVFFEFHRTVCSSISENFQLQILKSDSVKYIIVFQQHQVPV